MGGSGKSALACRVAGTLLEDGFTSSVYIDLNGNSEKPLSSNRVMEHVVRSFWNGREIPRTQETLNGLYQSILSDERAVILLDNASNLEQIKILVPPRNCACIITTRNSFAVEGYTRLSLQSLTPEDAQSFALKVSPNMSNVAEVIALCGNLPLAIRLAADLINQRPDLDINSYLSVLRRGRTQLINTTLAQSFERLDPSRQQLWLVLSVFPDRFDAAAAQALWTLNQPDTMDALGEFLAYSMLEWQETDRRYRLHDLTKEYAASKLDSQERGRAGSRLSAHFAAVATNAFDLFDQSAAPMFRLLTLEWPNIEAGRAWATANINSSETAAHLTQDYADSSAYLYLIRQPRIAAVWLQDAVTADRHLRDRKREAVHLSHLGLMQLAAENQKEATSTFRDLVTLTRNEADREGEAQALLHLGESLLHLSKDAEPFNVLNEARELAAKLKNRQIEADALFAMGRCSIQVGNLTAASQMFSQALAKNRKVGNKYGAARCQERLSACSIRQCDWKYARKAVSEALPVARSNNDEYLVAQLLSNRAVIESNLNEGNPALAILSANEAISLWRKLDAKDEEDLCLKVLGAASARLGYSELVKMNGEKAREFFTVQLETGITLKDPSYEAQGYDGIGRAFLVSPEPRNFEAAIRNFEQAATIWKKLGNRNAEGESRDFLGHAEWNEGQYGEAKYQFELALTLLGPEKVKPRETIKGNLTQLKEKIAAIRKSIDEADSVAKSVDDPELKGALLSFLDEPRKKIKRK